MKILWQDIYSVNNDPQVVRFLYVNCISKSNFILLVLRVYRETEMLLTLTLEDI